MTKAAAKIETWDSIEGEEAMQTGHEPSWLALIERIIETDLSHANVLDFGCNRGGFLRLLFDKKPFAQGLGVDIALQSVAAANALKGTRPVSYAHNDALADNKEIFDIAFSHEVVYLLPNLKDHVTEIASVLKPGGVYYLVIGEYAENPLWERWKKTVGAFSDVKPQTWSLQDIARAFAEEGFLISVRRLVCDGFLPYDPSDDKYLLNPMELIDFMTRYMVMFRFDKSGYKA